MKKNQSSEKYYRFWYKGKQFYDKNRDIAKKKRDDYRYECEHGIDKPSQITVFELADQWLPTAKASVSKGTYNQYVTIIEKMISVIGDKLVSAITPGDIKKIWVLFVGKSQSYINKAKFLYKSFFQYAIDNRYCTSNPVLSDSAKPHKGSRGTHRCLTENEIQLIETVPHRVQAAAMFMLKAGLRRGEVLALRKADIHDDRIWVKNAVKFVNNRPEIGKTKNESSERSVPLFAVLKPFVDSIEKYVLSDENGKLCSEMAFRRAWESYMSDLCTHVNDAQKRWYHLTKEWKHEHPKEYDHYLKLKKKDPAEAEKYRLTGWQEINFRPHDLRHTFVTTCRDKGIDPRTVMTWCGHSSERMIMQIYDHPSENREKRMIELMDK